MRLLHTRFCDEHVQVGHTGEGGACRGAGWYVGGGVVCMWGGAVVIWYLIGGAVYVHVSVAALSSLLQTSPCPSKQQVEDAFDGNICRCTGEWAGSLHK